VLLGDTERFLEDVRQGLRDHYQTGKAQKRTGLKVPVDEAAGGVHEGPETRLDVRDRAERIYAAAVERRGEPGRRFVEVLSTDGSISDAAKAAGVSRTTAHKYLRELKRLKIDER